MTEDTNDAALDRLDAIVIGATVDGLVAAVLLAKAGKSVVVLEREPGAAAASLGDDAVINVATAKSLDLVAHGLRFAPAPAVAAVSRDRSLVLLPDLHAARTSIAALSQRDAEAFESFQVRLARSSILTGADNDQSAIAWLTGGAGDPDDRIMFRVSSIARLLDETFDNDLLKGLFAQGAIADTGASPQAPGSGALLTRQSILAAHAPELGHRFVAGGRRKLVQALLAALRYFNNADVRFGAEVRQIVAERDAVQAVMLSDGGALKASLVVSSLSAQSSGQMLAGLRRPPPALVGLSSGGNVAPAQVQLRLGAIPKLPGIDGPVLASGAIVRLDPNIGRLTRAHGAFRGRTLTAEPCLDLRLRPGATAGQQGHWRMVATMHYLPPVTTEGPWIGSRRENLRTLCIKAIDAVAPGFAAVVEAAEVVHPAESETVMDAKGAAALAMKASLDLTGVPEARKASAPALIKGLTLLEPSIYTGDGDAGFAAAHAALGARSRAPADA